MEANFKRIISLVLVALMVFSFGGCVSEKVEPEQSGTGQATTGDTEPVKESVAISFTSYFTEENAEAAAIAYHQTMDKYLAENSNVIIDEEILAHDAYDQKMMTQAAANELPDMFQLKGLWVPNFAENEVLGEINDILNNDPEWEKGFVKGSFRDFMVGDKIYGVPYQIVTLSNLFYNKGIFEECGIASFPKNFTEFEDAIKKIKEKGFIPITAGNKGGWFVDVVIFRGILDRYVSPEWGQNLVNKTGAKFTDSDFVAALKQLKKFAELDAFNSDINSIDYMQMRSHFYNREAAMMLDGSGGILPFSQEAPEDIIKETEMTVLPALEDGGRAGNPGTAGWSIGYNSEVKGYKKEVVVDILKALSSKEHAKIIAENNGFAAVDPGEYDESKLSPITVKYNKMLTKTPVTVMANFPPAVLEVLYAGLQEILMGTTSPEDLVNKLQKELDDLD